MIDWSPVLKLIQEKETFVLSAHLNPDADALGSEVALYHLLKSLGKKVHIVNNALPFSNLSFLNEGDWVEVYDSSQHQALFEQADAFFILDVSSWDYMGEIGSAIQKSPGTSVCLDHHVSRGPFADIDCIRTSACATGEIVFDLIKELQIELDLKMATALYASIAADTGLFRFSNTSSKAHLMAAEFFDLGVDHNLIYSQLYEKSTWEQMNLYSLCLANLNSESDNKIVWLSISEQMLEAAKASWEETNGLIDLLRTLDGVQIAIIFREEKESELKVQFRSKGEIDVQQLAAQFGGGGHRNASGLTILNSTPESVSQVLEKAKKLV